MLGGVEIVALDDRNARRVGQLLGANDSADVVDAHVAMLVNASDVVLTSDPDDIAALLASRGVTATIESV